MAGGKLELWAPVQDYDGALAAAAKASGLSAGSITLYPMPIGDPSGRGMAIDAIRIAIELARRVGRPVQLTRRPVCG